ncbi:MAG: tRNA (N(6)-L-threonylcarbamoyladenosine(37)-C(2))-methylthiotransferase MtaB, partial [Paramuribaculum sp.]|nr:tRNA (N(6)-L-threonylcarbamoyladenosine(37)-C(2))-methylthiotransferase MtaB [Paramuribaculum sp.]
MPLTYLTHTFGCKLNFSETATIARMLEERGLHPARKGDHPDIVVVNTCSVTGEADKKCRQTIRAIARRHPHAAIAVTGCYVQLHPEEASSLPGVVVTAGIDRKLQIAGYLDRWLAER